MNKAEQDFKDLELYLEKAKEEIGQVLSSQKEPPDIPDGSMTLCSTDVNQNTTHHDLKAGDIDDILCLYDNMDFYHPDKHGVKHMQGKTVTQEENRNGTSGKLKNENSQKRGSKPKTPVQSQKVKDKKKDIILAKSKSSQKSSMESGSKDNSSSMKHEDKMLEILSVASDPDTEHVTDNLKNYSPDAQTFPTRVPDSQARSEDLLEIPSSNLETNSSLIGKGSKAKEAQVDHNAMQMREHRSTVASTDNSKLNDSLGHCKKDISAYGNHRHLHPVCNECKKCEGNKCVNAEKSLDDNSQKEMNVEGMDVKFEISNLIEKINESIDELIGGDGTNTDTIKSKKTSSTEAKISKQSSLETNDSKRSSIEAKNLKRFSIEGKDSKESSIETDDSKTAKDPKQSYIGGKDSKVLEETIDINLNDTNTALTASDKDDGSVDIPVADPPIAELGDSVVETDFGYYWVTSSIDEQVNAQPMQQSNENLASSSLNSSGIETKSSRVSSSDNVSQISSVETVAQSQDSLNDSMDYSDPNSSKSDLTKSVPNFLCLDRTILKAHQRLSKKDSSQSISDENLANKVLKRKYSAPPSFCRVYKVVSVDIPKMEYTRSLRRPSRFGDATKKCQSTTSIVVSDDCLGSDQSASNASVDRTSVEISDSIKDKSESKQGGEAEATDVSEMKLQPPPMFQDNKCREMDVTEAQTGPILEPPPAFASNDGMDSSTVTALPVVWDPGVSTVNGTTRKEEEHIRPLTPPPPAPPLTPPPPSANSTENLISSTLSGYNFKNLSGDNAQTLKQDINSNSIDNMSCLHKRSSDLDKDKYKSTKYDKQPREVESSIRKPDKKQVKDLNYNQVKEKSENVVMNNKPKLKKVAPPRVPNGLNDIKSSLNEEIKKSNELIKDNQVLCNHKGKVVRKVSKKSLMSTDKKLVSMGTNTTDSLDRTMVKNKLLAKPVENTDQSAKPETSPVYATVSKSANKKSVDNSNKVSGSSPVKPRSLPGELSDAESFRSLGEDQSPEFQVMFNSLSPVLLRRRSSRKSGGSVETSPESTPSVSPRLEPTNKTAPHKHVIDKQDEPGESLFMDPSMAQTWHGSTGANWSSIYGSQLRAMVKELEKEDQEREDNMTRSMEEHYNNHAKTLPSKSLLDEMHKRFCADQYLESRDAEVARALVLLRLKSNTPVKTKRSQSFNIRMGTWRGTAAKTSCNSAESSPMLPRVSERIRIKTRPDFQYSPKPRRAFTPEPRLHHLQEQSSRKEEAEIEAIDACRWLRETGFPQYAQLYEDGQFPVDIESVEKDHDFLDKEDIQSLFRRLNTLNKCAIMKIGTPAKKEAEDSDEEDQCALSDKWKYQRSSRRWSRKDLDCPVIDTKNIPAGLRSASSHDSLLADQNSSSETGDSPVLDSKMHHLNDTMVFNNSATLDANGNATLGHKDIRRAASERIKGAKSFLKRMESLKGKRNKKPKTITEISSPVVADRADMQAKIKHLNCKDLDISPSATSREAVGPMPSVNEISTVPELNGSSVSANSVDMTSSRSEVLTVASPDVSNSMIMSDSATLGTGTVDNSVDLSAITNGAGGLDMSTRSRQSNCSDTTNSSEETLFSYELRPGRFPKNLDDSLFLDDSNIRQRSYSYTDDSSKLDKNPRRGSHDPRHQLHRISIYDNVPIEEDLTAAQEELDIILSELFQNINGLNRAINGEDAELLEPPVTGQLDDTSLSIDSQTPENEPNNDTQSDITHEPDEHEVISGTLSSPDISDHELHQEETSHDDSSEHIMCRERRDSGVGSSLTRTNSERRKYRIRWHSFQKSHRPTSENRNLQLCSLSAGQILLLRKLSLLKLTALIEKYSPNRTGWSLTVPRFMKRQKAPDYKDKNVFGVPFAVMIQRTGQALPQCILHAMRFLRRTAGDALGIFRKSGVRSRIQKLRNDIEANPEAMSFEELQAYDVADLVKQYFRELPECLLTNKLSDMFISIFIYVPVELRLEALQAAVVLMADENRDVLQSLLLFLSDISKQHNKHQKPFRGLGAKLWYLHMETYADTIVLHQTLDLPLMTASNLAVCFAPSLFMGSNRTNPSNTPSPRRNRKNAGIPDARELMEQKAAHECLTMMILECKKLFTIPAVTLSKCRVWHGDPLSLEELNRSMDGSNQGYTAYIDSCLQGLLKESREKFRGWISVPVHLDVDCSYKKIGDGHPLRLYKCTVEVEAPPTEVLNRVLKDRQTWDEDLLQWCTVQTLDANTEVFQYVRNSMAPHPTRDYCVLRSWRTDLPKGACVLISMSIEHPDAKLKGGLTAVELASRYLIEPCGTGKSRLTHISRVDLKGHSPDWYKKVYGHICANFVDKIRASFHCNTEGPETKV